MLRLLIEVNNHIIVKEDANYPVNKEKEKISTLNIWQNKIYNISVMSLVRNMYLFKK